MMRSLFSGVSGLKNHQTRMDVIGNNISNVNTTGFKSSRVTFTDTLSQTLSTASAPNDTVGGVNPKQVGFGSVIGSIDTIFTDGSVQSTGKNTDLCISGSGLFVVSNGIEGATKYYTRNGAFEFDEAGNYVLPGSGMYVQGWMAENGNINNNNQLTKINVPVGKPMESKSTENAVYTNNLNAGEATIVGMTYTKSDGTTGSADGACTYILSDGSKITDVMGKYGIGEVYEPKSYTYKLSDGTLIEKAPDEFAVGDVYKGDGAKYTLKLSDGSTADLKTVADMYPSNGTYKITSSDGTSHTIVRATTYDDDGKPVVTYTYDGTAFDAKANNVLAYGFSGTSYTDIIGPATSTTLDDYLVKGKEINSTITIGLSSGSTITYPVADMEEDFTIGDPFAGTVSVTSVKGGADGDITFTVDLTKGATEYKDLTPVTPTKAGVEYKIGAGTSTETVASAVTDRTAGTVTYTFDGTGMFATVTIPLPADMEPKGVGDKIDVDYYIDSLTAAAGSTVTVPGLGDIVLTAPLTVDDTGKGKITIADTVATIGRGGISVDSVEPTISTVTVNPRKVVTGIDTSTALTVDGSDILSATLTLSNGDTRIVGSGSYVLSHSIPVSTTITVYDTLGAAHTVPINFEKTAANEWVAKLATTSIKEKDGTITTLKMNETKVSFNENGSFKNGSASVELEFGNGAANQLVAVNFSNLTQYSGSNNINASTDGNAAGTLSSVDIDSAGVIYGTYTNGVIQAEAQVAIAQFTNSAGLLKTGGSLYAESNNSGTANIKGASELGVTITPSALEMSNVDVANEFSDMIITQRGFQSNSKIITVSDEMLETLINMKR